LSDRVAANCWRQLRQGGHDSRGDEVPSVLSGVDADAGPVRFALGRNGEGRLLVPIGPSERVPAIAETPTLRIIDEHYSFGWTTWRCLDLTCLVPELDRVFGEVADEIVTRISAGHGAIRACASTLGEFRMLLVPKSSSVQMERLVGLIGELLLLDELLDIEPSASELWRGPLGERHDFRGGALAAEVKTTSRVANQVLQVTSIDQLLEPADGELRIVRYTLEETAGGSLSIGSLFTRIAAKSGNPLRVRDLLARMECQDPLAEEWNAMRFHLEDIRSYRIDAAFPRVVPVSLSAGGLPPGVSKLLYDVDLAAAEHARLSAAEHREFLERMIACL
jgi:hypothetical protein